MRSTRYSQTGRRSSAKGLAAACKRFNRRHRIGETIMVHRGSVREPATAVTIVDPGAYVLSGHTAVVQVTGGGGCIALDHVVET